MTTQMIPTTHSTLPRLLAGAPARLLGLLCAGLCAWALGLNLWTPDPIYAAELDHPHSIAPIPQASVQADDPLGALGTKMEDLAKKVAKIATPIAILCIVLVLVLYLFAPVLPDIAQQNKGYIMRALVIVAIIGLVPEIVKFAAGLAAG